MGLARRFIVRLLLIVVSLAWLASCAAGPGRAPAPAAPSASKVRQAVPPTGTEPGSLFNAKGQRITHKDFAAQASRYDYILLGESHGSRCDHIAQAALIRAMAAQGNGPVVGLEMVDVKRQDVLDEFSDGILDAQVVEEHLDWQKSWGYAFDLYEPIFLAAQEFGLPMAALNLPRALIEQVSAEGLDSLSPEKAILLPETIVPPPAEQSKVLEEVFAQHSSGEDMDLREAKLRHERFFLIQSLWDSKMAERAVETRRNFAQPVAVVAGAGHVEFGWGIAHRLKAYDPGAKVLLVMPWRGNEPFDGADVFYYCPPTHRSSMGMVLQEEGKRVVVVDVEEESRAGNAGLQVGDVITMAGATPVTSLWDLHKAGVEAHKAGKPLTLTVLRDKKLLTLDLGRLGKDKGLEAGQVYPPGIPQ